MNQDTVWLISLVLIAALAVTFLVIAGTASRAAADPSVIAAGTARARLLGLWTLLGLGVAVSAFTLGSVPYHAAMDGSGDSAAVRVIRVSGMQWGWMIEGDSVPAGVPVTFEVTSRDVNHGFGIYDDSLRVLAQVQAMPGYTNRLRHTFDRPGTYHILCLEFCGQAHHVMRTTFTVTGGAQ